jgi:cytoskeletal protein CcmA (bactofilin family)
MPTIAGAFFDSINKLPIMLKIFPSLICFALILAPQVPATEKDTEIEESDHREIVAIPAGEVIDHDYFAFGDSIEISGIVNGDVYAAGGSVFVDGQINGDLLAAGGEVTISGTISQDARIAGGRLTINGNIKRNLTVAGGNVEMTPAATVQGGVVGAGGNFHLGGVVGRSALIGAGRLVVSNAIGEDLEVAAGTIRLTSKANVSGDFTYSSGEAASIDSEAKIEGEVTQKQLPIEFRPSIEGLLALYAGLKLLFVLASFVSTLILGLVLIRVYPKFSKRAMAQLTEQPLASAGLGFLALIITPIVVGMLGMTFIGLPLALILLAVFFIYVYLARIFVIAWVGHLIFDRLGKAHYEKWAFVIGLILYSFITLLPFIGTIATFLAILFGLGTFLLTKKEVYVQARNQGMI